MMAKVHLLWYLWKVRLALTGSRKQKKKLLTIVEASVRDFASEHPGCDYRTLVKRFGEPERIAEQFVAEMEPQELLKAMQIRQKILYAALAAIALVMTIRLVFAAIAYSNYEKDGQGYAVVEIIEVEHIIYEDEGEVE